MCLQVSGARCQLVALLMGLSGRDSCAHLARVLTELLVELDALDVSSNTAVRNYRKQVVEEINGLLKHLDLEGEGDDTCRYIHALKYVQWFYHPFGRGIIVLLNTSLGILYKD